MSIETQVTFEQGRKFLNDGMMAEAIIAFKKAVDLEPNNSEYHAWYAQALSSSKQYDEALKEAALAIQLDPQNGKGYRQRGHTYKRLERFSEAINDYSKAINIDNNDSVAFQNRAYCYNQLQKYELAIQDSSRTIEIKNDQSKGYEQRGIAYLHLKNYAQAIQDFTRAIEIVPKDSSLYDWRLLAYRFCDDYENFILDQARVYALDEKVYPYQSSKDDSKQVAITYDTVHKHLAESLQPKLKTGKEKIAIYFPAYRIMWGRYEKQVFGNGTSLEKQHGTYGRGYICVTDKNLHIVSLGKLTRTLEKSSRSPLSFLGDLLMLNDFTEMSKDDQHWTIPYSDIDSAQIFIDSQMTRSQSVRVFTKAMNWDIYPVIYDFHLKIIPIALKMAKAGKFNEIWSTNTPNKVSTPSQQSEILDLIKQLNELKSQGIISETDFESKKKELLARL